MAFGGSDLEKGKPKDAPSVDEGPGSDLTLSNEDLAAAEEEAARGCRASGARAQEGESLPTDENE